MGQDGASLRMAEDLEHLYEIVFNDVKRRSLLELKDNDAQSMIDYLNVLLSHPKILQSASPKFRKHILIILQTLCENSMLYPTCYTLDGIEDILPKGAGGFCDVYQGRYRGQDLCLKVVRLYQKQDQHEMMKAHAREAILWGQLEHPNITPFYGTFYLKEAYGRICLLSPWMEFGTIVEYLKKEPEVPRRPLLHDIASGLEYLHNMNIAHGNLKGINVLVDQFSKARLTDFWLSKVLTNETLGFATGAKHASGCTTSWASPELLKDARPSLESDVWAFGCVCYEVLTGLSPFQGCTAIQVLLKLMAGELPAHSADARLDPNDAINRKLWQLIEECWSSKPIERPKCREILLKMKQDAFIWQLRTGDSNNETEGRPWFQYREPISELLSLNRNRLRQLLGVPMGDFRESAPPIRPTFIDGDATYMYTPSDNPMENLLKTIINGATPDSFTRHSPPQPYLATRSAFLERCLFFIANGQKKMRWVVGAGGVGKSAVMQHVADLPKLPVTYHVSVFPPIDGRNNGIKAILTLAYQLAAKSAPYRRLIGYKIARDSALLQSSMSVLFKQLIIEPFIRNPQLSSAGRVLIIIDGLDECDRPSIQLELLSLISDLCIEYPSSPLVWFIASRPEWHITSFFSKTEVILAYEKKEIPVDSDEAREDIERFIRDELMEIKKSSDKVHPLWPRERDFWKLVKASGGLFAYAHTIVRYVGDTKTGNPILQLRDVLNAIDNHPTTNVPRGHHSMASLDALYGWILSNIPSDLMINARKLLLALVSGGDSDSRSPDGMNFVLLCNWLCMTRDEAYTAIRHLACVLRIPEPDKAAEEKLESFHRLFLDYISDFARSEFSSDIRRDVQQLHAQRAFRILQEAPNGIDFSHIGYDLVYGTMKRGSGKGDNISLTWLAGEEGRWNDNETRLNMYQLAIGEVITGMRRRDPEFQSMFCIRLLTTQFEEYGVSFPFDELCNLLFDQSRRHEFTNHGILKQIPLEAVDVSYMFGYTSPSKTLDTASISLVLQLVKLQVRRPNTTVTNLRDPWHSSCQHGQEGEWEGGKDWKTTFGRLSGCAFCTERLKRQLESWKTHFPGHTVPVMFTSTGWCCVELRIVDSDYGMSEWTYWFWCHCSSEKRKQYGSIL